MKSNSTQREKLEAKEAAIMAAAHSEFGELGFEGAKMANIARRAHVAEGTVYLYYRNKAELLQAVVARFWRNLTDGARRAIDDNANAATQLEQLARYHLSEIMADFDFVGMTSQVRQQQGVNDSALAPIRGYVRAFDDIFDRGKARGEIRAEAVCWHWRDLFYGQLEYSARTLLLRQQEDIEGVLEHMRQLMAAALLTPPGTGTEQPLQSADARASLMSIERRLAAIEQQLVDGE